MSVHSDWPGLSAAIAETGAERIFVTHGYTSVFRRWLEDQGYNARIGETDIPLAHGYANLKGKTQIGVRLEFTSRTSDPTGLPVTIRRIEDVGRHKIIRTDYQGTEINVIADEGAAIDTDATRIAFDPSAINVYADDWRVAPSSKSVGKAA